MGKQTPQLTAPTLKVLGELLAAPPDGIAGADLSKTTGIPSGTLYPILFRMERAGWLSSEWEQIDPSEAGRPRKRFYRLTPHGSSETRAAFDELISSCRRVVWQS
jgi:DNA-binding PadR family transcriptional regulator